MNYVYTGGVYLPVPVSVPAGARPGQTVSLKAAASWLVCKDVCIPENANLSLDLPVAAGPAPLNPQGAAIAATLAAAPKSDGLTARFQPVGDSVKLFVAGAALKGADASHAYFYPYDGTVLEQASPQRVGAGRERADPDPARRLWVYARQAAEPAGGRPVAWRPRLRGVGVARPGPAGRRGPVDAGGEHSAPDHRLRGERLRLRPAPRRRRPRATG